MSVLALSEAQSIFFTPREASGPSSAKIIKIFKKERDAFWGNSITLAMPLYDSITHLDEAYFKDCAEYDWDGYGALPISNQAYAEARDFLELIPSNTFMPSHANGDANGSVMFEWYINAHRLLSVQIDGSRVLQYAGIIGTESFSGRVTFIDAIPKKIIEAIKDIYS